MKRKIIYVDFIFRHRRVGYFRYYILSLVLFIKKNVAALIPIKNSSFSNIERKKISK